MRENVLMKAVATANIEDVKKCILNLISFREELGFLMKSIWLSEWENTGFVFMFAT